MVMLNNEDDYVAMKHSEAQSAGNTGSKSVKVFVIHKDGKDKSELIEKPAQI